VIRTIGRVPRAAASRCVSQLIQIGELCRNRPGVAFGTDTVAERGFGVLADVFVDLLPVILVVANLLTVGADGKESLEALDP